MSAEEIVEKILSRKQPIIDAKRPFDRTKGKLEKKDLSDGKKQYEKVGKDKRKRVRDMETAEQDKKYIKKMKRFIRGDKDTRTLQQKQEANKKYVESVFLKNALLQTKKIQAKSKRKLFDVGMTHRIKHTQTKKLKPILPIVKYKPKNEAYENEPEYVAPEDMGKVVNDSEIGEKKDIKYDMANYVQKPYESEKQVILPNVVTTKKIIRKAYKQKPMPSYPKYIIEERDLLQMDLENSQIIPIGSSSYRGAKYGGDFDFLEVIEREGKEETVKFFADNLIRVVKSIKKLPTHYFMEVKCGSDERYRLDLDKGETELSDKFKQMLKDKLISNEEYELFISYVRSTEQIDKEKMKKLLRDHRVIRWEMEEILANSKKIPNGTITLEQAIQCQEKSNIELTVVLNNTLVETSNFFVVQYTAGDVSHGINANDDFINDSRGVFIRNIVDAIKTLLTSKIEFYPYKAIKRYYSLAKYMDDDELRAVLFPFINNDIGEVGKVRSELQCISKVLKKYGNAVSKEVVMNQIESIKYRLISILSLHDDTINLLNMKIIFLDVDYAYTHISEFCDIVADAV
jgi:hypothetical protein